MKFYRWSPDQLVGQDSRLHTVIPSVNPGLQDPTLDPNYVSGIEGFKAAWERENLTVQIAKRIFEKTPEAEGPNQPFERGTSWSPFIYIHQNWDEKKRQELDHAIRAGLFDDVETPDDLEARAFRYMEERENLRKMEAGGGFGAFLGGLAGGLTDLTSFVPLVGAFGRVRNIGTIARGAAIGATATAIPEIGLQSFQDLRTAEESFMNIGVGALLGGGIGTFARFASRNHPMNPTHPDNPLHPENIDKQPTAFRNPGVDGSMDVIDLGVGAAEAPRTRIEGRAGITSNIPGLKWVGEKIDGATPAGRALQWSSTTARALVSRMMDLGGRTTNLDQAGVAVRNAEAIKMDLLTYRNYLFEYGDGLVRKLNMQLGQSRLAQTFGREGTISYADFNDIARDKLLKQWTGDDTARLVKKYGDEATRQIEATADEYARKIHETNAHYERELLDAGLLRRPELVERLKADRDVVRERLKQLRAAAASPADKAAHEAEVARLREEQDALQKELDAEMSKPEAMGEDYGHAQLYDDFAILSDRETFEDELMRVLADSPDDEWLIAEHGVSPSVWAKLGSEPVELDGRTLTTAEGMERRNQLMELWLGDQDAFRLHSAEMRYEAAQRAHKQAKEDLQHWLRDAGILDRKSRAADLSEARKKRDLFAAEVAAHRARVEALQREQEAIRSAAEASRTITLERQLQLTEPGRIVPDMPAPTPQMATTAERARGLARELHKAETRLKRMEERLARADAAFDNVSTRAEALRASKRDADEMLKHIKKTRRVAEQDLAKAKRSLLAQQRRTPLWKAVEDITQALINRETLPRPLLDKIMPETGRVKARRIHYTPEQRKRMEELGFLRTDLPTILRSQYESLAGHIGLTKGLDIGTGKTFESWSDVTRALDDDYRDLIARAKTPADKAKLTDERRRALKDLNGLKDRLLGTENLGMDREGWVYWLSSKVRQANLVRFMAGFTVASLNDVASVHLRTGRLGSVIRQHGREALEAARGIGNPSIFRAILSATELGVDPRIARGLEVDDLRYQDGIGAPGTMKHAITSRIDQFGEAASRVGSVISGMQMWNRYWKALTGIYRANRIRDMVGGWSKLTPEEQIDLTSLGIGKAEAARIDRQIKQHGFTTPEGHWDPNLEAWMSTREGQEAARDFRMAIQRDMSRGVFTPGIGDTPILMSHGAGKLWLQFQTFAFTFMNRFIVPASQRLTAGDVRVLVTFAHLTWTTMISVMMKDLIRGEDPAKRFTEEEWGNTAFDIIDRSGLMTYLSPYVDSGIKASTGLQEAVFGQPIVGPSSRYARNSWSDSLLGANFGLYRDMRDFGAAVADGNMERVGDKGLLLLPYNTYARVLMNQLEAINE